MKRPLKVEPLFPEEMTYPTKADFSPAGDMRHPDDKLPSEESVRRVKLEDALKWARELTPELVA